MRFENRPSGWVIVQLMFVVQAGWTPLMQACVMGNSSMVEILLADKRVSLTVRDKVSAHVNTFENHILIVLFQNGKDALSLAASKEIRNIITLKMWSL